MYLIGTSYPGEQPRRSEGFELAQLVYSKVYSRPASKAEGFIFRTPARPAYVEAVFYGPGNAVVVFRDLPLDLTHDEVLEVLKSYSGSEDAWTPVGQHAFVARLEELRKS